MIYTIVTNITSQLYTINYVNILNRHHKGIHHRVHNGIEAAGGGVFYQGIGFLGGHHAFIHGFDDDRFQRKNLFPQNIGIDIITNTLFICTGEEEHVDFVLRQQTHIRGIAQIIKQQGIDICLCSLGIHGFGHDGGFKFWLSGTIFRALAHQHHSNAGHGHIIRDLFFLDRGFRLGFGFLRLYQQQIRHRIHGQIFHRLLLRFRFRLRFRIQNGYLHQLCSRLLFGIHR